MFKHIANLTAAVHTRLLSLKLLVLQIQEEIKAISSGAVFEAEDAH